MKNGSRKLKVSKKFVRRSNGRYKLLPEIRLGGIWLNDAGFEIDKYVIVSYSHNELIIKINI